MLDNKPRIAEKLSRSLRSNFAHFGSEHKQIAQGMLVVGSFVLIAKLAGMTKEMAVAWRYGVSETVDAYLFVFNVAQWPLGILAGVIASVLVPFAVKLRHEMPGEISQFRAELLGAVLFIGVSLGAIAWLLLPWLVQQSWVGLTVEQITPAVGMASYMSCLLPLGLLARLFATWTMAGNRHLNTLAEGAPALAILAAVFLTGGSRALIGGTIVGFAIWVLLLYFPLASRAEIERPLFSFKSPHWRLFLSAIGTMILGQTLMSFVTLADQFFAAHLGLGSLSTLGYANRILSLVLGLGATVIARASLPVLSRAHVEGQTDVARIASRWAVLMFGIGMLITILGLWLAPEIVKLIFQRGQFSAEDTARVAVILRYSVIQVPFYFSSIVLVYALLSQERHTSMIVIGASGLMIKLLMALILVPKLGLGGLVLSTSGVYLVTGLLAIWMLGRGESRLLVKRQ